MATTFKPLYSGTATAITISLASLTSASYQQSAAIDNSTNLYLDAVITGNFKTGASGVSASGFITIYVAGYDGTQYSNNASGSNASFTPDLQGNLLPICTIGATANATTYYIPYVSVAAAAGWFFLPQKWSLIIYNGTGATFDTTAGNFLLEYQGINIQGI